MTIVESIRFFRLSYLSNLTDNLEIGKGCEVRLLAFDLNLYYGIVAYDYSVDEGLYQLIVYTGTDAASDEGIELAAKTTVENIPAMLSKHLESIAA
jgi:hypothetical protein